MRVPQQRDGHTPYVTQHFYWPEQLFHPIPKGRTMSAHLVWLSLLFILHLVVIARVLLLETRSPYSRAAWVMLLLLLPGVGVALYVFFGEPWVAKHTRSEARLDFQQLQQEVDPTATSALNTIPARYQNAFKTCTSINGFPVLAGNQAELTADSNASIDAMVSDFAAAQSSIHISFYIWLTDHNGNKIVNAVIAAARRGVTCRIVVDAIGSRALIASPQWQSMQQAGVKLAVSMRHRFGGNPLHASRIDLRNHRKIVIVDDSITYCGSQNCADPEFLVKAKYAPWVDIMLRCTGPVATQNQMLFADDWMVENGENLPLHPITPSTATDDSHFAAVVFGTGPMSAAGSMSAAFSSVIACAQRELVISTPYFVPDHPLQAALVACSRRGVAVTLIVPARNDSWFVGTMSRAYYASLIAAGVNIQEFHGGLLHAKTMVIDGEVALIGSANMDRRSLELNFENNILLHSPHTAALIRTRQDSYLAKATAVTAQDLQRRPKWQILLQNFLTIFEPIF